MANAGYSADYQLCRRLAAEEEYIRHKENNDKVLVKLKNYINDYVYIRCNKDRFPTTLKKESVHRWQGGWQERCDNIIIEMNQLRQRNWYWKEIKP